MAIKRENPTKVCTQCNVEFAYTAEHFGIDKRNKSGLRSWCRGCGIANGKAWQKRNPERHRVNVNKWRKANPDKRRKIGKVWREENNDKTRSYKRQRRARIKGNGYEYYNEDQVLKLYGTNCYLCDMPIDLNALRGVGQPGWRSGLHIEHFIDIARGGPDTLENVRPSHAWCNLTKAPLDKSVRLT